MMSAKELQQRADTLARFFGVYFVGQEPSLIGTVLADLMSTFLLNHKVPDDLAQQERLREGILRTWCETVRELVAAAEMQGATKQ